MRVVLWSLPFIALFCSDQSSFATFATGGDIVFENKYLIYAITTNGQNHRFEDRRTGLNYVVSNSPCALVKRGGKVFPASSADFNNPLVTLRFADANVEAVIRITSKETYFLSEVASFKGTNIDELVFASVPLTLTGSNAEPFAACALALNLQTLVQELPQPSSRLMASSFPRFGFVGAQVALVATPPAELRQTIQQAVKEAPDLPKSSLGGPWAWDAPQARGSYLFDFGNLNEQTVGDWIGLVKSLGFTQIDFHGGRSFRFGDCRVNPDVFPRGREGFKSVIEKLHSEGISAGLHTYAFFIDKKTDWVTPVPDPRLASDKIFNLAETLTAEATTVSVSEPTDGMSAITGFFVRNSVTLRVDEELITYASIAKSTPYGFTECKRGAYGTRPAPHLRGAKVAHLKECFGLLVPDPETTLLAEVAQRTADFYNECGFDMIYLDALDGEDILGGGENGWHYGSQFVFELAKRLKKPALMEMSTFHHHLWYVRSRAGAWDHPRRAEKQFIDLHLASNETYQRMFLPANLGWWAVKNWTGAQEERTFPDDIEYLCTKALATDSGLSLMGIDPKNASGMARLAKIFQSYETVRQTQQVPKSLKEQLRAPGAEFHLEQLPEGGWQFLPARYNQQKVESLEGNSNRWKVQNEYRSQPLKVRIETLMSAGPYDAATNIVLADADNITAFTNRLSAPGVSSGLILSHDIVKTGLVSLQFSATNGSSSPEGAWTKVERKCSPPLNLSGREGLGLWVHGDGQGELLNIQLRCPEHVVAGIGDHYIKINFKGWRYFELIEPESKQWALYKWPYGDPYSIYRESVSFSQVSSISLWLNNIPAGKTVACYLSPLKALPLIKSVIRNPIVKVGDNSITFPIEIESGSYLEWESTQVCKVYGPKGELKAEKELQTKGPELRAGENMVTLQCEAGEGIRPRANVTVSSYGPALVGSGK
jgi:hypothetical protein